MRLVHLLVLVLLLVPSAQDPAPQDPAPEVPPPALKNTLRWTTASELENFGFDVYRGPSREGPWTRITRRPIRGAGSSDTQHRYTFVDDAIEPGQAYWYWVESISFTNRRKRYSPFIYAPPKQLPTPP